MRRLIPILLSAALLASCITTQAPAPVTGSRPRLAVVIVVDGLPQRQAVDYRDQLAPDGFERFFTRGAWFTEAHYGFANTETAPGHATIFTGANPSRSGIIANQWVDPATGKKVYCFEDPDFFFLKHRPTPNQGSSPKNLLVDTIGDALRKADERSKVIAISGKDRSAIAGAGKRGVAYVYQPESGTFDSTTYYLKAQPKWVADFNATNPSRKYAGAEWKPLLPESGYSRSLTDGRPWYDEGGKLPKKLPDRGAGMRFQSQMMETPFFDDLTLSFARAAVAGEELGKDGSPDLLVVSLSTHDSVNHSYGAESRISHDHMLYLDRALQDFFSDLDVAVGRDNYVAVLTSDHGFTPVPEHSVMQGRDAGRLNVAKMLERVNQAMEKKYSTRASRWAQYWSADGILINRSLFTPRRNLKMEDVLTEARLLLAQEPGIAAAYTRGQIEAPAAAGPTDPLLEAVRKSYYAARSPDVQVVLKPYWLFGTHATGTSHGSPHPYDTNVPIMLYGPSWILPARVDKRVDVTDIAPTLARLLGVAAPATVEGKPLPLDTPGR